MNEATKDQAVLAARFDAALELLKQDPRVDSKKIAAIGYCFGGSVVLGRARAGADLAAVVSFHGALATKSRRRPLGTDYFLPCRPPFIARSISRPASRWVHVLSRYPVLKIHHTAPRHRARNPSVTVTLTPTLTSAIS